MANLDYKVRDGFTVLSGNINFTNTNAILPPSGNTAQRPTTSNGAFRFNTDTNQLELYANSSWGSIGASINTAAQYTWTNTHTFNQTINGTANNALNLNGVAAASYVQNTDSRTLSGNLTFTGTNIVISSNTLTNGTLTSNGNASFNKAAFFYSNVTFAVGVGISANDSFGTAGQVLTTNGSVAYWSTVSGVNTDFSYTWTNNQTFSANVTVNNRLSVNNLITVGNSTVNATVNSTVYTGTANNATNLGGVAASGYQTTAGLSANVATLTSNNATNLGGVAAASYVQNTDSRTLSGNLNFTGANTTIAGNLTIATTGDLIFSGNAGIYANGTFGTNGQILTTNGTSVYWANSGSSSNLTGTSQTFTSNGYANISLSSSINPADAIVTLNGLTLVPTTDYTISGNTLTFTTTPASGDSIEVRTFTGSVSGGGGSATGEVISSFLLMGA